MCIEENDKIANLKLYHFQIALFHTFVHNEVSINIFNFGKNKQYSFNIWKSILLIICVNFVLESRFYYLLISLPVIVLA